VPSLRPRPPGEQGEAKTKLPGCKTGAIVFHEHTDEDGATCKLGFECLVEAADRALSVRTGSDLAYRLQHLLEFSRNSLSWICDVG
jgi:hypothetical protein